jgi:hypothetical protein
LPTEIPFSQQVLLTGFVILCDWLSSSGEAALLSCWRPDGIAPADTYAVRFSFSSRPLQAMTAAVLQTGTPRLLIL